MVPKDAGESISGDKVKIDRIVGGAGVDAGAVDVDAGLGQEGHLLHGHGDVAVVEHELGDVGSVWPPAIAGACVLTPVWAFTHR